MYCYMAFLCIKSRSYNMSRMLRHVVVSMTSKFNHVTPILKELHWLPVAYRVKFKILILIYKILHDMAPDYLKNLIVLYKSSRPLRFLAEIFCINLFSTSKLMDIVCFVLLLLNCGMIYLMKSKTLVVH